jgi:hypothetical protein
MREILGVLILLSIFRFAEGQTSAAYAQDMALKVGVCGSSTTYPCKHCKFNFVALAPGKPKDQLFFLETTSPGHCGSGGCTGTVYRKDGNQYRDILHIFGFFDRSIPRSGQAPDLVYLHVEFPKRDYNRDGQKDKATIRVQYRWNTSRLAFDIVDILSIDVYGQDINPSPWRKQLIREWQSSGSPWVN